MADVLSGGRKDFNELQTVAGHVVVAVGVLLSVGDEEAAADVLRILKGAKPRGMCPAPRSSRP